MYRVWCLVAMVAGLVMAGCSDDSQFRVTGSVDGLGTQNLRVIYYTTTGIKSMTATAVDGKFNFIGNAPAETLVEIFTSDRVPLMRLAVKNGETVEVKINRAEPYKLTLKGNDASQRLATFMRDNSEALSRADHDAVNSAIATYVGRNTKDLTSTILLLTEYYAAGHEAEADSLLQLIDAKAKPEFLTENLIAGLSEADTSDEMAKLIPLRLYTAADSMTTYNASESAYSLLIFTRNANERPDSLRRQIASLTDSPQKGRVRVADISIAPDSAAWHSCPKVDTKSDSYLSAWMPGAIASLPLKQLSVTRTPYFIVADSTGTQLYRGSSIAEARKVLEQ